MHIGTPERAEVILTRSAGYIRRHDSFGDTIHSATESSATMKLAARESQPVVTLGPTDTVTQAFRLMVENGIRHLPITQEEKTVGIVSDRDLLIIVTWINEWRLLTNVRSLVGHKPISEMMTSPVSVLTPDDTVEAAARLMIAGHFSAVPIEQSERLVGIFTESDAVRYFLGAEPGASARKWHDLPVAGHMSDVVISALPTDHVMPSFHVMQENGIRHLPVLDGDALVGLISDRDLRRSYGKEIAVNLARNHPPVEDAYHAALADFMSRDLITARPSDTLADVARLLVEHRIGAVPVTDGTRLRGIITETDLLQVLVQHVDD